MKRLRGVEVRVGHAKNMTTEIGNNLVIACRRIDTISTSEKHCLEMFNHNNKQLLDENEHDINNYCQYTGFIIAKRQNVKPPS